MNRSERITDSLLPRLFPGAKFRYSPQQASGECDFIGTSVGGDDLRLEVTVATNETLRRTYAAIGGRDGNATFIDRNLAQSDWWVHPTQSAKVRMIRQQVDEYLSRIEGEGLSSFSEVDAAASPGVLAILTDLSIEGGQQVTWNPPGRIGIAYPGGFSWLAAEHVVSVVEKEAWKNDNRRKLAGPPGGESHLFILVDSLAGPAYGSILHGMLPTAPPSLPAEIRCCWVACCVPMRRSCVVWSVTCDGQWNHHGEMTCEVDG